MHHAFAQKREDIRWLLKRKPFMMERGETEVTFELQAIDDRFFREG